jgi:methylmalonyl-CoA mutase N-terminal domain/subunit
MGQTGLNIDFDVPTKLGLDPDHLMAEREVGLCGTSVSNLQDMEQLFEDIPLDKVSTTLIIQPPYSAIIMAMFILVARERGIPEDRLMGTIMNDAVAQLVGLSYEADVGFFPFDPAVRIGLDVMEYCIQHMPKWNILNINAYNMRETGNINSVQEVAFSMCLASDNMKQLITRGLNVDQFARRIAFFSSCHIDFLEEIAKFRAMRRIWAKMLREGFQVRDEEACRLKIAVQTSALALTAQQPLNNIARTAIQTLAAVLGGVQSIHTTSYDEAYALPTEESHKLSLRIQQILAYETNVVKTVDPMGGAYVIEWLTDRIEAEVTALMRTIEEKGGFLECFKDGWIDEQVNRARLEYANRIEKKEYPIVGVNIFQEEQEEPKVTIFRQDREMQEKVKKSLRAFKENRDQGKVKEALHTLYLQAVGEPKPNLFQPILQAVEARATLGEISHTLRQAENFELKF